MQPWWRSCASAYAALQFDPQLKAITGPNISGDASEAPCLLFSTLHIECRVLL